jgi:hypothetical protein
MHLQNTTQINAAVTTAAAVVLLPRVVAAAVLLTIAHKDLLISVEVA